MVDKYPTKGDHRSNNSTSIPNLNHKQALRPIKLLTTIEQKEAPTMNHISIESIEAGNTEALPSQKLEEKRDPEPRISNCI